MRLCPQAPAFRRRWRLSMPPANNATTPVEAGAADTAEGVDPPHRQKSVTQVGRLDSVMLFSKKAPLPCGSGAWKDTG